MIQTNQQWNGPGVLASVQAAGWEAVQRCTVEFWRLVTMALNVSNPRPYLTPSKPGEPPRKRTGWLQRNLLYQLDQATATGKVGIARNAIYGVYWEVGIRGVQRPFLLSTLAKNRAALQAIAAGRKGP